MVRVHLGALLSGRMENKTIEYQILPSDSGQYRVQKSDGTTYVVNLSKPSCTCLGYRNWRRCKHIPMVQGYRIASTRSPSTPATLKERLLVELAFQEVEERQDWIECRDQIYATITGAIIDIETTGLDPSESEIITVGTIMKDRMVILQRRGSPDEFYKRMDEILSVLPTPVYAYVASFEGNFLGPRLKAKLVDLQEPWRLKGLTVVLQNGLSQVYDA